MAEHWVVCPDCTKARRVNYHTNPATLCASCAKKGDRNPMYGKVSHNPHVHNKGYRLVWLPEDDFYYPMAQQTKDGYIYEHRLIMAQHLGRCLLPWEIVHHKNGIKDDNRIENLELMPDKRWHLIDAQTKAYIKRLESENKRLRRELALMEVNYGSRTLV